MNSQPIHRPNIPAPIVITRITPNTHGITELPFSRDQAPDFQLLWVRTGTGTLTIDLLTRELVPDLIFCISPGCTLHQLNKTADLAIDIITFKTEFIGRNDNLDLDIASNSTLFGTYGQFLVVEIKRDCRTVLAGMLNQMLIEFAQYNPLRTEIMRSLLRTFLLYMARQADKTTYQTSRSRNTELVTKFMLLLEKNYIHRKLVIDYADELAVTPNYLNEVVKRVSGHPASYHIQQRVALEAKRQAVYNALSMKEVALKLGFQDMAHFSKYFKRVVGINFTDYKKEATNQL